LLNFTVALAPIVLVIALLVLRVSPTRAALAALATAVIGTWLAFPLSSPAAAEVGTAMGPTTLTVIFILLGGVGLTEVSARSGGQAVISRWLRATETSGDRLTTLLLIALGVTPFMESVTGFGLGVVITAPLLVGFGLSPARAVVTGTLGLVLVPWGSLGPGTLVAAELGQVDFTGLGVWSAVLSLPVLVINAALIIGLNQRRIGWGQAGFVVLLLLGEWLVLIAANYFFGPPLAGVLASGWVIAVTLWRLRRGGPLPSTWRLGRALLPYAILVGGLVLSNLAVALARGSGKIATNPALWLNLTVLITVLLLRWPRRMLHEVWPVVWGRWQSVALVTLLYMLLGSLMSANGMAEQLASTAASLGGGFTLLVPLIGALGGYLTGSNTGAAAMFSTATVTAANQLGSSPLILLAGQNVAGSVAIIASPPRVAFAVSVTYPPGQTLPASGQRQLLGAVGLLVVVLAALLPWVAALAPGFGG